MVVTNNILNDLSGLPWYSWFISGSRLNILICHLLAQRMVDNVVEVVGMMRMVIIIIIVQSMSQASKSGIIIQMRIKLRHVKQVKIPRWWWRQ